MKLTILFYNTEIWNMYDYDFKEFNDLSVVICF